MRRRAAAVSAGLSFAVLEILVRSFVASREAGSGGTPDRGGGERGGTDGTGGAGGTGRAGSSAPEFISGGASPLSWASRTVRRFRSLSFRRRRIEMRFSRSPDRSFRWSWRQASSRSRRARLARRPTKPPAMRAAARTAMVVCGSMCRECWLLDLPPFLGAKRVLALTTPRAKVRNPTRADRHAVLFWAGEADPGAVHCRTARDTRPPLPRQIFIFWQHFVRP
jgi:hypothetical protein